MENQLNELFDYSPLGLSLYDTVDGIDVYSSEKIEERIIYWCRNSHITKPIASKIEQGLRNKKIIVGFTKSPMSIIWFRFKSWLNRITINRPNKFINGYYSIASDKIVIFLDKNVNIFGNVIRAIPPKLTHELVHMAAINNQYNFLQSTMNDLVSYYSALTYKITGSDTGVNSTLIKSLIVRLAKYNETIFVLDPDTYETGLIWNNFYKNAYFKNSPEESVAAMNKTLLPYLGFIVETLKPSKMKEAYRILDDYYRAYEIGMDLDARNITTPGQECKFPSEVIAITNEFNIQPNVAQLIKDINFQ